MPLSPASSPRSAWTWQYSPNVFLRAEWEYIGFVPVAGDQGQHQYRPGRHWREVLAPAPRGFAHRRHYPFARNARVDRGSQVAYSRQWDTPSQRGAPIWKDRL